MASTVGVVVRQPEMEKSNLFFPFAPQPDILRATQKDEFYKRVLYERFFDLVQDFLGPRVALNVQDEVKLASDVSYYGLTQLLGTYSFRWLQIRLLRTVGFCK